jgi:hypothetical protein
MQRSWTGPIKRYKPEQIVTLLRQIEVEIANGKTTPQACKEAEITVQTFDFQSPCCDINLSHFSWTKISGWSTGRLITHMSKEKFQGVDPYEP